MRAAGSVARVEPITSTRNERVRDVAALSRARVRHERGQHLVEGPNAVAEALAAGVVEEVFVTAAATIEIPAGVEVTPVADHVMERLADVVTPQGVVALARTVTSDLAAVVGSGLLVVLHEVADPGNAGVIVRTADAAGASGVVLTAGSVDPFSPKAIRAASGSTYHLPVVVGVGLDTVAGACREAGQRLVALASRGSASVFDLQASDRPVALVFGNEAHGLPGRVATLVDATVAVPLYGAAESLNVAAAAAIALYAAAQGLHRQD